MFIEALTATHLFIAAAADRPGWCTPPAPPKIIIKTEVLPIRKDFTKTTTDLSKFQIDTVNPYGPGVTTFVGGLTRGSVGIRQQMSLGGLKYGSAACGWYETVEVKIVLDPHVFVARDFKPHTCRHKAIWNHEMKHVALDKALVEGYAPLYRDAIRTALLKQNTHGPVSADDVKPLQKVMMDRMKNTINRLTAQLEKEREKRQAGVDTREEYERVRKECRD